MKHSENYVINTHDTDATGNLSVTGCMRYIQDTAFCHLEKEKPSYDELFDMGYSFIVSRIKVLLPKALHAHDEVTCYTWAIDGNGASFRRCYEMEKDGMIAASASSVWAMLDMKSGRLARPSDAGIKYSTDEVLDIELPRRIPAPQTLKKVGEYKIAYRDVDKNLHMNNTVYADLLYGYIPDIAKKRVTMFDIYFKGEARLDDTIEIFFGEVSENTYYFKTVRSDGKINVEVLFETENI